MVLILTLFHPVGGTSIFIPSLSVEALTVLLVFVCMLLDRNGSMGDEILATDNTVHIVCGKD